MDLLTEYERRLAEQVEPWGKQAVLIFRGQSNKGWKFNSSADRRLGNESNSPSLSEYLTKLLIEPARSEGYAHQQNKKLNDLELLAKLQHHGAATCLIDFTANFHIALWFACEDDKNDGKIFVVNRGDTQNFKEVTPERAKKRIVELLQSQPTTQQSPSKVTPERAREGITELLQPQPTTQRSASSERQPEIYYWKPPANENRIVVQHSCFIFSAKPINPGIYQEIFIAKEHKQEIRTLLQKYYGIDNQSIFRDFGGFAASQGQDRPITPIAPTSEEQLLRSGNRHFQQGKFDKAIEDYDEIIRINPESADAYNNRGAAKGALCRHQEAIADFDEAVRINPQYANAHENRGNAKSALGQYHDAIADYDQAIRISSQFIEAYYDRGNAKSALGQYHDAIADYDQAIRINPQSADVYNNRGIAKSALGQYHDAIADYDQAIRINPQSADAYNNRGIAKRNRGRHLDAIADYDQVIRINPQFADAYYNRGIAKDALGWHDKAIADYDQAIGINPQFADAYNGRGNAKRTLGRYPDAIVDYDQVIRINPQFADAYNNRGATKGVFGRHEEAIVDFNEAIDINPQYAEAYCNRGITHKAMEAYEKARADLQRASELATDQGNQALSQDTRSLLDQLPPVGED